MRAADGGGRTDASIISDSLDDPASFSVIFDRHFDVVYGYLARRIGPDVARDLASETFMIAFRRRADFDVSFDNAGPWLFGVASNLLRNHVRAERRQLRAYARSGVDPTSIDETADSDRRLDAERAGPTIAGALARLREEDREVLSLFVWASLSYEEIAMTLGCPIGTVRSRLSRARRRLRELLDADGQLHVVGSESEEMSHER